MMVELLTTDVIVRLITLWDSLPLLIAHSLEQFRDRRSRLLAL